MSPANSGRYKLVKIGLLLAFLTLAVVLAVSIDSTYRLVENRRAFWTHLVDDSYSVQAYQLLPADKPSDISWIRKLMGDFSCGTLLYRPNQDYDCRQLHYVRSLYPEAIIRGWPGEADLPKELTELEKSRAIGDFVPSQGDPRVGLN